MSALLPSSGQVIHSITSSALVSSVGRVMKPNAGAPAGLPAAAKGTSVNQTITSQAGAILVNVPALDGWHLLQRTALAIPCTTGIYAFLFSGLNRRKALRGEIGIERIECSRTH